MSRRINFYLLTCFNFGSKAEIGAWEHSLASPNATRQGKDSGKRSHLYEALSYV
jgi:hypothetical protein